MSAKRYVKAIDLSNYFGTKLFPIKLCSSSKTKCHSIKEHGTWKCISCDLTFSREDTWKQHVEEQHGVKQPFGCSICGTKFTAKRGLNKHMALVHTEKRPWKCSQCDLKFKIKYHLTRHVQR